MRNALQIATIIVILLSSGPLLGISYEWYESAFERIDDPDLDNCLYSQTDSIGFEIDRAEISFTGDAEIYVLPSVGQKLWGVVFRGDGKIRIEPPTHVERFALDKMTGDTLFERTFDMARLYASPEIISSIRKNLHFDLRKLPGKMKRHLNWARERTEEDEINLEAVILAEIVGDYGDFAWFDFKSDGGRFAVEFSNTASESFTLKKTYSYSGKQHYETVISCFPKSHYESGRSWKYRSKDPAIRPLSYTVDAELTDQERLGCKTRVKMVSHVDSLYSLSSSIFYKTDVDSVFNSEGESLFVSKRDEGAVVTVFFDDPIMTGDTIDLTYYYRSKKLVQKDYYGNYYIASQTYWYPVHGFFPQTHFDLSFRCPKNLILASIGDQVADSISGDYRYTRWITSQPERYASFNYGYFDTLTMESEDAQNVVIYRGEGHYGDLLSADMRKKTGSDIIGALMLYNFLYGEIPYDPIRVTEIPYPHGQGTPGLLHLSWGSFQGDTPPWTSLFRAHEVAHQWWGHKVAYDNYHDQWMSEACAEFSAAWFVQVKFESDDKYLQVVDEWRKSIVQKGGGHGRNYSMGTKAGPIWLGYRLASSKSNDYYDIMYCKGAYVLHMLRCMMRDWAQNSDERFAMMMKDFAETYNRKAASTLDFQQIVEKHIGESMEWFFDQWVYNIEVPKLKFDKKVRKENGKYYVDVKIKQEKVPDDFISVIPIRISFDNNIKTVLLMDAVGHLTETTLPPLDYKPKDIDFNYFKGALTR